MRNEATAWPPVPPPHHQDAQAQQQDNTASMPMTEAERAAERTAFAELLAFIDANKDPTTQVDHVTTDDYNATLE